MMFTIHQKRFSFLKKTLISFFTNGANRPGVNRPVRKMVLERTVPGGTGFGANRPGVNRPVRKMVLERTVPGGTGFGANRPVTDRNGVGLESDERYVITQFVSIAIEMF